VLHQKAAVAVAALDELLLVQWKATRAAPQLSGGLRVHCVLVQLQPAD
jgi:hypothetical protein